MHQIRLATLDGKSVSELGDLHNSVKLQLQAIASNPEDLINGIHTVKLDYLSNENWSEPGVFTELKNWANTMPYLPELLSAFCLGALETWGRFTQDLMPGDIPLSLSPEETMKSFAPPTNDANEGALGTWRVWSRQFPSLTVHRFNAIQANRMNQTEDYMQSNFTPDLYSWIRQEARRIDTSKREQGRKLELVTAAEEEAHQNAADYATQLERQTQKIAHIQSIELELDLMKIDKMVGSALTDQLKAHRQLGESTTHKLSNVTSLSVPQKKTLVKELVKEYLARHSEVFQPAVNEDEEMFD